MLAKADSEKRKGPKAKAHTIRPPKEWLAIPEAGPDTCG
mgnify:FL=1